MSGVDEDAYPVFIYHAPLVHRIEHWIPSPEVAGLSPAGRTHQ